MNKYIKLLMIPLLCICLASCSSSRNMVFHGKPGTKVYTASGSTLLATIGSTGEAKIELSDDVRSAFFIAQPAGSSLRIPFGLNYKKCGYGMNRFLEGLGMTTTVIGLTATVAGVVALAVDSESSAAAILSAGGAGVGLLGASFGAPESARLGQLQQENGMKYITNQYVPDDFQFTQPVNTGFRRELVADRTSQQQSSSASQRPTRQEGNSISNGGRTSEAAVSVRNHAKAVAGTYIGIGRLTQNGQLVETYRGISVVISRLDNNTVSVDVATADGQSFFSELSKYSVVRNNNGTYTLRLEGIPSAKIVVNNGALQYTHPRVNIDGEVFTLEITTD